MASLKRCDLKSCQATGAGVGWWEVAYADDGPLLVVYPDGKIPPDLLTELFTVAVHYHFCEREHALEFLGEKLV